MIDDSPPDDTLSNSEAPPGSPTDKPSSSKFKIGKPRKQAPSGKHLGRVVHVDPNWTFHQNRKIAVHFEVMSNRNKGTYARLFFRLNRTGEGEWEIAAKSKLARCLRRLFPEVSDSESVDLVDLFRDRFFDITVEPKESRDGEINAIVIDIEHHDPGF